MNVSIPIRRGRRKTTLPAPTQPGSSVAMLDAAFKQHCSDLIKRHLSQPDPLFAAFQPDPWDEAVKWIEQRHADRIEWPWPSR
jgi:hypothetical protein